jgi:hypothetical protein
MLKSFQACRQATAEAGEGGEAARRVHPVDVHVLDPLDRVVAARDHVIEAQRLEAVLLGRLPGDRVQADVREDLVLEVPDVPALLVLDDARPLGQVLGGQAVGEHPRVLDEMVVYRDDLHIVLERHRPILHIRAVRAII